MEEHAPLTGYAALADRPVDGRRVAMVMAVVGLVIAVVFVGLAEHLLASANVEADGGRMLRQLGTVGPAPSTPPQHVAVVLIDGLRVDEARALSSWRALRGASATGTIRLGMPTLSRPFYHHLFTGVPAHASGVRSNRFDQRARHDSVMDRVRAAGGHVFIAAGGLDWMRRMHGRPGDGGSDQHDALERGPLDRTIAAWRAAAAPSLLVVHHVRVDSSAHQGGVHSAAHARALAQADAVVARVAASSGYHFLLSDHGHRDTGGHGGDEPEVASAPILVRGPAPLVIAEPLDPDGLASSIALALGVARPRSAISAPIDPLCVAPAPSDAWYARAAGLARAGRQAGDLRLAGRRHGTLLFALVVLVLTLGPIKRAYGFDRSVPVAMLAPLLIFAFHLALGRPFTLSAIDSQWAHVARVAATGGLAASIAIALARIAANKGDVATRWRRAAATAGWACSTVALVTTAGVGFALGPWSLSPTMLYLPLLACGGCGAGVLVAALVLFVSVARWRTVPTGAKDP